MRLPTTLLFALLLAPLRPALADEAIWLEGEAADNHSFNQHGWYCCDSVRTDVLSEGAWLAHFTNEPSVADASWTFTLEEGGDYAIWVRTNPFRSQWSWAMDQGAHEVFDVDGNRREWINLIAPGIDIRFLAWELLGVRTLEPGDHSLSVRIEPPAGQPDGQAHSGVDALVVVNHPWAPTGALKPGEAIPAADVEAGPGDWFAYTPNDATLAQPTVIDSSDLVPAPAGQHGPLGRTEAGDGFAFDDGTPVNLWGVGVGAVPPNSRELADQQARFLRRYGVNAVRMHSVQGWLGLGERDPGTGARTFDPDRLDRLDAWFAAFKAQGIYVDWSLFYPHLIRDDEGYDPALFAELEERRGARSTSGMVNFMRPLQDSQWEWAKSLLEHENPYTGMRYVDDPALAIVEVHNEDCLFFHYPLNPLAAADQLPLHSAELKRQWMQWTADTYGTTEALRAAWGAGADAADAVDNPDMRIYGAWEFRADGPEFGGDAAAVRMGDFIRFLAETQRDYYQRRYDDYRGLGYQGVIVTTAWHAGGPAAAAANTWADDAGDAIDRHAYFGGGAGNHGIAVGEVNNGTHLETLSGGVLSGAQDQVADKPFIVTEWTSKPPNQWKAEAAPLFALVGMGAQGWDGSFHFTNDRPRMEGGWPRLNSYVSETPHYMGQWPALARAVHEGHVAQAPASTPGELGPELRHSGRDSRPALAAGGLATGRYSLVFDGAGSAGDGDDVAWDQDRRVATVTADRTKAVIGFAGGGSYDLGGITVDVDTPFVSLLFTALDGEPVASSGRVLVTALAQDRELDAEYNDDGTQLTAIGRPPLLLEPVQATITLDPPRSMTLKALTVDGVDDGRPVPGDGSWRIDGRWRTFYYLLETEPTDEPDPPDVDGEGEGEPPPVAEPNGEGQAPSPPSDPTPAAGSTRDDGCGCGITGQARTWWGVRR